MALLRIDLDRTIRRIREARADTTARMADLHREDGKRKYAADEHHARVSEIERIEREAVAAAEAQLAEWRAQAEEKRKLAHGDPMAELSLTELQRAAQLAVLVRDYVDRADPAALARTADAVAQTNEKLPVLLYHRYVELRLGSLRPTQKATGEGMAVAAHQAGVNPSSVLELEQTFERLSQVAAVHTKAGKLTAEAAELDAAIEEVRMELVHGEGAAASRTVERAQRTRNLF